MALVKNYSNEESRVKRSGALRALCECPLCFSDQNLRFCSNYMTSIVGIKPQQLFKKSLFTADAGVQTETSSGGIACVSETVERSKVDSQRSMEPSLSGSDLASILKWSTDISSDINLSSGEYFTTNMYSRYS